MRSPRNAKQGRRRAAVRASCIVVLLGLLYGAAPAPAIPGALDRSFGYGGKTVTAVDLGPRWNGAPIQAAIAPNGDILVAAGAQLARYLPEGRPDPGFGSGGLQKIELPGGLGFSLGDLAVDSHSAAVVIGTATGNSASGSSSSAAFLRYRNDGSLDPSFGGDGVVLTDFGLQESATDASAPPVTATLGAVDSAGRIIAVGGALRPFLYCAHGDVERRDELVARLTPDGQLDPAFGDGGIRMFFPSLRMTGMALRGAGESVFAGMPGNCNSSPKFDSSLLRVSADSSPVQPVDPHEIRGLHDWPQQVAIDPQGRTVVLGATKSLLGDGESVTRLVRLGGEGDLDRSFGQNGTTTVRLPGRFSTLNTLATDPEGGVLLAGTRARQVRRGDRGFDLYRRWPAVAQLRPSGMLDRSFGRHGFVFTRFGAHSEVAGQEALVDSAGRLLVAGSAIVSGRTGFALARYMLTPR